MKRTFVVGDIHGCFDELIELTEKIGLLDDDLFISVGDIVDRGAKSKEVYHYFKNRPNSLVLMGNHERKHMNNILSYSQEITKLRIGDEYAAFVKWISDLTYYYETEDAIIVHAAMDIYKALHEQKQDVLSGTTSGSRHLEKLYPEGTYWTDHYNGEKPVIFGHHVVGDVPEVKNNTYGIDTAACHGGYLTAIELPGFVVHQVKSKKDYWKEEMKQWQVPVLKAKDWLYMDLPAIKGMKDKHSYKANKEVLAFLNSLDQWLEHLDQTLLKIFQHISELSSLLAVQHGDQFNKVVSNLPYSTFLFKSKAGNLNEEYIRKSLNTPAKIIKLAEELELDNVPDRVPA